MTDNLFFINEDEVLAHHGVKGMKWGVHKQRAASGGAGSTKKRKGLSRKQKAAIAGVLGTAAAAGAGYYLHKSGKGKKIAALAKKAAQGKGRNLGAQARVKKAQAKRFAKGAAEKLKTTKAGKYAEATRLATNAAAFKTGNAVKGAGYKAKNQAWKAGNKARKAAEGGVGGAKSAAGMAARSAKSAAGMAARSAKSAAGAAKSKVGKKTPGKALSTHVVQPGKGVGYRKLATSGAKVVRGQGDAAKKLAKIAVAGVGVQAAGNVAGAAGARALNKKLNGGKKSGTSKKRRR